MVQLFTDLWSELEEDGRAKEGSPNSQQFRKEKCDVSCSARHPVSRHGLFYAARGDVTEWQGRERRGSFLTMYSNAVICCIRPSAERGFELCVIYR